MRIDPNRVGVISTFATPIAHYQIPEDKHQELKDAVRISLREYDTGKNSWSANLFHYYQKNGEHLLQDNDAPIFDYFETWLKECYADFVIDLQGWQSTQDAFITDCWVNITKANGSQVNHTHANAFVSGTYYLNMEGDCGDIVFMNPAASPSRPYIGFQQAKQTMFSNMSQNGCAKERLLVLWPGNICHYTMPTGENSTRVSISMNFMPEVFTAGGYNFKVSRE